MNEHLRIGLGIDVHRLEPGRPCTLGGVRIDGAEVVPVAHSDGDVVLHAACDAVLGAMGEDDLGTLFPDSDPANAGRNSADFCRIALEKVRKKEFTVWSMDIVVETNSPRLQAHRKAIRDRVAGLFGTANDRVNVKGKSGEKVDAIGRGEAIRATVVALLAPQERSWS